MSSLAEPAPSVAISRQRQSCDRCHGQKVRCVRDESLDEAQDESRPCIRCTRAGVTCFYSYRQRPGRPPLNRPPPNPPEGGEVPQNFDRYLSFESADSILSSIWHRPGPWSQLSIPDDMNIDGNIPHETSILPTSANASTREKTALQYGFNDIEVSPYLDSLSPPRVAASPHHSTECAQQGHISGNSSSDPIETHIERLASLNVSVFRSARAISGLHEMPLTVSSPHVKEIFEHSSALINTLEECKKYKSDYVDNNRVTPFGPIAACLDISADTGEADAGLFFLVLASYQRLLSAFDIICSSILAHLQMLHEQNMSPPGRRSNMMTSPVAESVMLTELIVHLIDRLDRAVNPLIQDPAPGLEKAFDSSVEETRGTSRTTITYITSSDLSSSSSSSLPQSPPGGNPQAFKNGLVASESRALSPDTVGDMNSSFRAALGIADATGRRHGRLQERIRDIKKLIKSSNHV